MNSFVRIAKIKCSKIMSIFLLAIFASSCTTMPKRFQQNHEISHHGGYIIESEDDNGFYLEVFYKSYSFFPNPDDNIQEAKNLFVRVAQRVAQERNRTIKLIHLSQLKTNSNRNILDGVYAIYVSDRIEYAQQS